VKSKFSFVFVILILIYGAVSPIEAGLIISRNQNTIAEAKKSASEINFMVSMSKPWTHLLEVEMRLRGNLEKQTELVMPVWTPGSYSIREYARHVQDFAVKNAGGAALSWDKTNKNTWLIQTGGVNEIIISYNVYANELTVRTNELNDRHAFFTPAALLLHPKGQIAAPSIVRVMPYKNWKVATGLPSVSNQPNTFRAANFDILYDSPFEIGDFEEFSFEASGKPHRFVIEGGGNYNLTRIQRDVQKIVETAANVFSGELPYENYLFILNTRGGGGLEHLNSTALQYPRFGFSGAGYTGFLGLVAHEYFHLWNVKRIRPDALGPFDYSNENYSKLLWVAEGGTDYYASLILRRAGLITDEQFLMQKAQGIANLQKRPGRFQTSVEESSFDAWIKNYRPDENSINREISYYDKGDLVMMMLDLEIRRATGGTKSMDDVMRYLYAEFYKKNRNYTPEDFQKTAELHAGTNLNEFFRKYVRGREEIDYNSIFSLFGIRLETTVPNAKPQAFLGANLAQQGERLTVTTIPAGTPAYEQGLNAGDQIVAVNEFRASQQFLNSYLAEKNPGDKIKLTIFRNDDLRNFEITLGSLMPEQYRFAALSNPTEQQKRLYQNWLSAELQ
jgi:predicted metalloprotease with PDZ domain